MTNTFARVESEFTSRQGLNSALCTAFRALSNRPRQFVITTKHGPISKVT